MAVDITASSFLKRHGQGGVSLLPSIDDLDLATLLERLDDQMLERVDNIARSPLPLPIPCDEKHFSKCLRIMLAVLPRQGADDLTGELFVAAYQRKLGNQPNEAISFLVDKAMEKCRWFPTIAECLEILEDWRRDDEHTRRKELASRLARNERSSRSTDHDRVRGLSWRHPKMTQAEIDRMPPDLIELGLSCRTLRRNTEGKVVEWFDDPEDEETPFG